jgi:hypothetical protein
MSDIVGRDALGRVSSGFLPRARFATARRPILQRLFRRISERGIAYDPYDVAVRRRLADHLLAHTGTIRQAGRSSAAVSFSTLFKRRSLPKLLAPPILQILTSCLVPLRGIVGQGKS